VISCIGVPEALRGRELFGCAESTYPSLPEAYDGGLARAAGGTLVVDHADLLGSDLWQALAKAISDGASSAKETRGPIPLSARVIAVSRSPLSSAALRELPHHAIEVPPLAARTDDILPLASHFLALAAADAGVEVVGFTAEARAALVAESWPGNARELAERIGQALRLAGKRRDLGRGAPDRGAARADPVVQGGQARVRAPLCDRSAARCDGNISRAARLAKKDRKDFYDVIRRTGVDPTEFR
jgi:two-component system response regulator GlrR